MAKNFHLKVSKETVLQQACSQENHLGDFFPSLSKDRKPTAKKVNMYVPLSMTFKWSF